MTLLVIAADTDETAHRFAGFAVRQGFPAVVEHTFGRIGVSVHVTRDRVSRTRIVLDGAEVSGILNRGIGDWSGEQNPDRAFAAAETCAALWSAVALWPGPVVNRPSERGFLPRLDPLELVAAGVVTPPRTVILNDGSAPGQDVCRIPEWTVADPRAPRGRHEVVQITDRDPARTCRILVAGTEVFTVEGIEDLEEAVAPIVAWLHRWGVGFADFTVEPAAGVPRLVDVSCWPGHHLFPHGEDQVYAALLSRLVP